MPRPNANLNFIIKCPVGAEPFLKEELQTLGIEPHCKKFRGAVSFNGSLEDAYRAGMWSRIASRLLLEIKTFCIEDADDLYKTVYALDWNKYFNPKDTFAVETTGMHRAFDNTKFASLKTKDAIVDQFRKRFEIRPSVDKQNPDIRISIFLSREDCSLSLDLFSTPLFQRGTRRASGINPGGTRAPLKENLAATLLHIAGWKALSQKGVPLFDPMCGSGTLLMEAAMVAANIAPGIERQKNAGASFKPLSGWKAHEPKMWEKIVAHAQRQQINLEEKFPHGIIFGCDVSSDSIHAAKSAIRKAAFSNIIKTKRQDFENISPPQKNNIEDRETSNGLFISNPPYGERLGNALELIPLYQEIGNTLRRRFLGWDAWIFTGSKTLAQSIGLSPKARHPLFNGPIECRLLHFPIAQEKPKQEAGPRWEIAEQKSTGASASPFENKLRKNLKHLKKIAAQYPTSAYRIYDADIPEYNFAVDVYGQQVHVQCFLSSKLEKQNKEKVQTVLSACAKVLDVTKTQVHLKVHERKSRDDQYQARTEKRAIENIQERGATFETNLSDYLDTGMFLDMRNLRKIIEKDAKGKSFLNLFAYTSTASVSAALGGANKTTSVDLSNTYLEWSKRNFKLSGLSLAQHQFIKSDCLRFIAKNRDKYDTILLAPPSWSRSKSMETSFDIHRDYRPLIRDTVKSLNQKGTLYFVTHAQDFHFETGAFENLTIGEITQETCPFDFKKKNPPHRAWKISFR